jgi:predicted enzyme related to lactoylglutathione lyase
MKHLINWVEIPALDIERAKKFYSKILGGIHFTDYPMPGAEDKYALFPSEDSFNAGALVQSPNHKPCADGVVVYFDGGKDMDNILREVENAGGQIIMPKTFTGTDAGHVGMFIDSEGNKIGLQHP